MHLLILKFGHFSASTLVPERKAIWTHACYNSYNKKWWTLFIPFTLIKNSTSTLEYKTEYIWNTKRIKQTKMSQCKDQLIEFLLKVIKETKLSSHLWSSQAGLSKVWESSLQRLHHLCVLLWNRKEWEFGGPQRLWIDWLRLLYFLQSSPFGSMRGDYQCWDNICMCRTKQHIESWWKKASVLNHNESIGLQI